ncbi:MAG: matrixin family metalloprotease [Marinobacter sp.]|nr:matrixin family metalloprotease [Marinobacter sp.]
MNRVLVLQGRPCQFGYIIKSLMVAVFLVLSLPLLAEDKTGAYRLLELDGYKVKWGEQTLGVGARITYAFADETMQFDGARNCGVLAPMKALSGHDLPFEILERETAAAFRVWERAADLTFHRVSDARDANIVLGAQGKPRMRAFANVSSAPEEKDGVRTISQSLVCLNPEQRWKVGFGGDKEVYDIRYTLIHEIGHAIGLDHPGPSGQVMGFRYTEDFPGLQPGDLLGIRRLYGRGASGSQLADGPEAHLFKSVP